MRRRLNSEGFHPSFSTRDIFCRSKFRTEEGERGGGGGRTTSKEKKKLFRVVFFFFSKWSVFVRASIYIKMMTFFAKAVCKFHLFFFLRKTLILSSYVCSTHICLQVSSVRAPRSSTVWSPRRTRFPGSPPCSTAGSTSAGGRCSQTGGNTSHKHTGWKKIKKKFLVYY